MKAPEKIYLEKVYTDNGVLPNGLNYNQSPNDIEYTRTDAFIEKACAWLKNHYRDYMHNPTGKRLETFFSGDMCNDFKNYMEGE